MACWVLRFSGSGKMGSLIGAITKLSSGRLCSPTPAQYAIPPALNGTDSFQNVFVAEIRERRDFAVAQVNAIDGLSCTTPDAAFYLMIKAGLGNGITDERFVLDMLSQTGVLVVPGSGFGCDAGEGYFRLVYLANVETLRIAFDRIAAFVGEKHVASGSR
jgi:alanine-synthesizing transaminase